ncbi:MAG: NgoFVII family restriction endonuclease [Candidatus Goldbacteria bacterium]|nr:NgoFVII family restriction endonuclease [Candidatus Goldiibacteriota bacterium]
MFIERADKKQIDLYEKYLMIVGSLSNLFSESDTPYLYYRIAEKIFCRAFNAEDLSRSDLSADAKVKNIGVGLKTFLINNSKTFQKIAEFNNDRNTYDKLNAEKMIIKIAGLRNKRLEMTRNVYKFDNSIYHCVVRDKGYFYIHEESMDDINLNKIKKISKNTGSISFSDDKNDYSFLTSKSTLTKRFITDSFKYKIKVSLIDDPLQELEKLLAAKPAEKETANLIKETIYLPLYGHDKKVYEKSGLNQWNAGGRKRDLDEVYIPIPSEINKKYPDFFPKRDTKFNLKLPDGILMESKICQDNNKALMSTSNKELGKWILRDVLTLKPKEILNYDKLQIIGIDSVRIDKINDELYEINFAEINSYENFLNSRGL